jgi:prepilin-type N-terminal cleavage/methylation domain-containing protein
MGRIIKDGVKKGFSLVELSIVMSIIGLLVGGVLAGQSLINGQRKNAVISKMNSLRVAYNQFKIKYGYPAGDLPTATQIWGRADNGTPVTSNCASPSSDNANPKGTCNGNGSGRINSHYDEGPRTWQQLSLAGFLSESYSGVTVYGGAKPGTNMPTSEFNPKSYFMYGAVANGADVCSNNNCWDAYDGDYKEALLYSTFVGECSGCGGYYGEVASGEDAFSLDSKIDDGLPASGQVRTLKPAVLANCTTGTNYDVSKKTDVCAMIFMNTLPK